MKFNQQQYHNPSTESDTACRYADRQLGSIIVHARRPVRKKRKEKPNHGR